MIFRTERLLITKLILKDLDDFYKLESDPEVLKFATGTIKNLEESRIDLNAIVSKYNIKDNNFWIYAVKRKSDATFLGTVALVKDGMEDEIGYRFLKKYWGNGYGLEICKGLISYCKQIGKTKLIAYVVDENKASAKILERLNFKKVKHFMSEDIQLPETKYEIIL
ncbi:GNAT family N-acetyltransferase [uncultured Polaribacter sp.]|uniref:GNAT family N-acetyltransferase n=1 Tax=uncultured Polaribacter sp. TaxID=174711 RepID=UPI002608279C|nr:GNAT family N-acetyltransferase [uncultured Polaribacter sp.]